MKKLKPFLKWPGGKRWLYQNYYDLIPTKFNRYIEPFLGGGSIFFHTLPSVALLGDSNLQLIKTYAAIKKDWWQVVKLLEFHEFNHSREYYYKQRETTLKSTVEIAAQFIYLNRTCFRGIYRVNRDGKFNVPFGQKNKVFFEDDNFEGIARSLQGAQLYNCDFEKLIDCADYEDFLFVDPPYTVEAKNQVFNLYNAQLFSWNDQERLCKALVRARERGVKILATNAYHDSVIDLYSDNFELNTLTRYSSLADNRSSKKQFNELLIRG